MDLRDIVDRNLHTIPAEASLQEAALQMAELDIGMLAVAEGGRVTGTLTDRDICVNGVARGLHGPRATVRNAQSNRVVSCDIDLPCEDAAEIMRQRKVRRLVVTEEDAAVGVLSLSDIAHQDSCRELAGATLSACAR